MKFFLALACAFLCMVLQPASLLAETVADVRTEADLYYQQGQFNQAYKSYLKAAKAGDHYSQDKIARMLANGEGRSANMIDAYAWSVLAAEGGDEAMVEYSESLLPLTGKPEKAKKKAAKYIKRYGRETQQRKAEQSANRDPNRCIGSLLGCKRR